MSGINADNTTNFTRHSPGINKYICRYLDQYIEIYQRHPLLDIPVFCNPFVWHYRCPAWDGTQLPASINQYDRQEFPGSIFKYFLPEDRYGRSKNRDNWLRISTFQLPDFFGLQSFWLRSLVWPFNQPHPFQCKHLLFLPDREAFFFSANSLQCSNYSHRINLVFFFKKDHAGCIQCLPCYYWVVLLFKILWNR